MDETIKDLQDDLKDCEELKVAPPRRSDREHEPSTTMMHNKNFEPITKQTHAQVARGNNKRNETRSLKEHEEMVAPQQSHNIDSLNGEENVHNMHEA